MSLDVFNSQLNDPNLTPRVQSLEVEVATARGGHPDLDARLASIGGSPADNEGILQGIRAAIASRRYDAIVVVSTTISAALVTITDNAYNKRYLLYVPNGTYTEEITGKPYVDIVGQSRAGVIVTSASGTLDTLDVGGVECMVANMTIRHLRDIGDPGVQKYPIHVDSESAGGTPTGATIILYGLTVESLGTAAKSGVGIGLRQGQRLYIVDCECSSTTSTGIFAHNLAGSSSAVEMYLVNTTATGGTYGFQWNNQGSGRDDRIAIFGGEYTGTTADIGTLNNGGSGEAYIYLDENVSASAISLVAPSKRLYAPLGASLPTPLSVTSPQYTGRIITAPVGAGLGLSGEVLTYRADGRLYIGSDVANFGYFTSSAWRPLGLYRFNLNSTATDHIQSVANGTVRVTAGSAVVMDITATEISSYLPIIPQSNGLTDLGTAARRWRRLFVDFENTATVGNVTINKAAGRVNVTAGATAVTVTNSLCTAAAKVFATVAVNDATAYIKNVVPAAGSFVINLGAAATANCAVDYFIVNV